MNVVTVSPKGQITIPKGLRNACQTNKFSFEVSGRQIILTPLVVKPIEDDIQEFSALGKKSFSFWDNESDDIYQNFYENQK